MRMRDTPQGGMDDADLRTGMERERGRTSRSSTENSELPTVRYRKGKKKRTNLTVGLCLHETTTCSEDVPLIIIAPLTVLAALTRSMP